MSAEELTKVNEKIDALEKKILVCQQNVDTCVFGSENWRVAAGLLASENAKMAALIARLPQVQAAATAAAATTELPSAAGIEMKNILAMNPEPDLAKALEEELPFKIAVADSRWSKMYPDILFHGMPEYNYAVDTWIARGYGFTSETAVTSLDQSWVDVLTSCVRGAVPYLNQHDPSSSARIRPDTTLMKDGVLLLKGEAKLDPQDMEGAKQQLMDSFFPEAYACFPLLNRTVLGVTTCSTFASVHLICWQDNHFTMQLHKSYNLSGRSFDRVAFIVDIFKAARWMITVDRPMKGFHLPPSVTIPTRNGHHVTWCRDGILKAYHEPREGMISRILQVYDKKLPHVEWGHAVPRSAKAIMITRVGMRLATALSSGTITKETVIEHVRLAVNELHGVGYAHCDIVVDNVFVDNGGAFLDDLEYLTPVNDPAPINSRWTPSKHPNLKAGELDRILLGSFAEDVYRL